MSLPFLHHREQEFLRFQIKEKFSYVDNGDISRLKKTVGNYQILFESITQALAFGENEVDVIEDNGVKIGEKRISISRRLKDDFLEAIKGRGIF